MLTSTARALGLGKLKLYGWHRPIGLVRKSIAEGGPFEQWRTEKGRLAMLEAAMHLPELPHYQDTHGARIHYLSGSNFWYQTVFCFVSLQLQSPFRITPVIHDDGTLAVETRAAINRIVPWAQFVGIEAIQDELNTHLPTTRFPSLRARRLAYPHLRKLTDLHVAHQDWGLVLDSDMLFFRPPSELIEWFSRPSCIYMQDIQDAYGYTPDLMKQLAHAPVLPKVNVGLYAIDRRHIDWDRLEYWCRMQLDREGPSYLQEQGLTALILTAQGARPLNAKRYVLLPNHREGRYPTATLHHYVAHSKRSFFQYGWRHILASVSGTGNHADGPEAIG